MVCLYIQIFRFVTVGLMFRLFHQNHNRKFSKNQPIFEHWFCSSPHNLDNLFILLIDFLNELSRYPNFILFLAGVQFFLQAINWKNHFCRRVSAWFLVFIFATEPDSRDFTQMAIFVCWSPYSNSFFPITTSFIFLPGSLSKRIWFQTTVWLENYRRFPVHQSPDIPKLDDYIGLFRKKNFSQTTGPTIPIKVRIKTFQSVQESPKKSNFCPCIGK